MSAIHSEGFRLPNTTSLGPVRLLVGDLVRSLEYYQRVLGLRPISAENRAAVLGAADDRPLVYLNSRPGIGPAPPGGALGLYHFAILLPDRAALGRFLGHIANLGAEVGMADHAVSEAIYLRDPDGLGIEIYADRSRSTWRYSGGQLYMTTKRLDLGDVIAASGGQAWSGMPAGTVIGHIHLHVGDIDRAAAFYHAGLGFEKMVWSYPGALFMSAGGYHHHLAVNTWSSGAPAAADQARLLSWDLVLPGIDDVRAAAASLRAAGHDVASDGDAVSVSDPWGTTLRIVPGAAS
jgi:catechol 2,3-dioxygenase